MLITVKKQEITEDRIYIEASSGEVFEISKSEVFDLITELGMTEAVQQIKENIVTSFNIDLSGATINSMANKITLRFENDGTPLEITIGS